MIRDILKGFSCYVKKPDPFVHLQKRSVFYNQLFPLVIICLTFSFASVVLTETLQSLHIINHLPDFDLFKLKEKKMMLFLMVVLIAPIIEELIFRFQLKSFALAFLFYFLAFAEVCYQTLSGVRLVVAIITLIAVIAVIFTYVNQNRLTRLKFIRKAFPIHFYFTAICFGLAHISNYQNPFEYGPAIILLVLPQLFLGFALGYTRMKFGIFQSMALHAAYNLIPALALIAGY